MKRHFLIAAVFALLVLSGETAGQGIKGREIFGVRIGAVGSSMELDEAFGRGSELELFFVEGLTSRFGIGASLSGHDFGKSKDMGTNIEWTGLPDPVDVMILSATVTLFGRQPITERWSGCAEAGGGLYTTTASIPIGAFTEGRITKNQGGIFFGAGVSYRLLDSGLAVDLAGKFHYVFSGSDYRQALYVYTGEETVHFYQITLGMTLFTGKR
ncbi:MAG: hypothetical protein PHQ19_00305 [Candidatus Krumholzibacteria bacterium]|nr:hypothetical protein [Candidatus Krumholzibacteria bacterium]